MIILKDINKTLNSKKILDNITVHISKNEKVGLIGLNGAGKTTLLNVISGMLKSDSGFIRTNGEEDLLTQKDSLKNFSYISGTKSQLWDDLPIKSTYENLGKMYGISKDELEKRLEILDEVFHVKGFLNKLPKNLSMGERNRCELVYGLLIKPKLLLIDEALIGLDVSVKYKIIKFFEQYKYDKDTTIIFTSNNLSEVENICERILLIDNGKLLYDGNKERILKEFAPLYKVKVTLNKGIPDLEDLPIEGYKIEQENEETIILEISYDKNKIDTAQIIKSVMEKCTVGNIKLYEPKLEEVIKKIYERKEGKENEK